MGIGCFLLSIPACDWCAVLNLSYSNTDQTRIVVLIPVIQPYLSILGQQVRGLINSLQVVALSSPFIFHQHPQTNIQTSWHIPIGAAQDLNDLSWPSSARFKYSL